MDSLPPFTFSLVPYDMWRTCPDFLQMVLSPWRDDVKEVGTHLDADGIEHVVYRHTFTPPGMTMEDVGRLLHVDIEEWKKHDNKNDG